MNAVLLGDTDETLLDVAGIGAVEAGADPLDLGHVVRLEREAVRGQGVVRILDEPPPEFRMLDRTPYDGADHFITHVKPPDDGGARDGPGCWLAEVTLGKRGNLNTNPQSHQRLSQIELSR